MPRREALHYYLTEVVRDLVNRGEIRRRAGEPLADILKKEPDAVLRSVVADLSVVSKDIGDKLLAGLGVMVANTVASTAGSLLANFLKKGGRE